MPYKTQKQLETPTYKQWQKDLDSIPRADQIGFILETLRSKKMLHIFGRFFFPHIIRGDQEVPECHLDLIAEINRKENGAIIFPRSFAKSTWIKIDTIHDCVYALEPVILYIGVTIGYAGFHFEAIKSELEVNELLREIYGNLVPSERLIGRKWTNTHFETTNGVNVVAKGAGKGRGVNIKNQRPSKIICDDIEDDEQVRSPERCMQLHDWLYNVIFPSRDPKRGYIKMIGTVLVGHAEVLKFHKKHGGIFRRAIENGKSIWPYMWPLQALNQEKKDIGSRAFSREYMNNPIDVESAIIKPEWVHTTMWSEMKRGKLMKIMAMDPQAGESKTADYYGIVIVGYYRGDPHRYIMARYMGRKTKLEQAALFVSIWQKDPDRFVFCGVEKIMTQVAVYQLLIAWKAGKLDFSEEICLKYGINNDNRNIPITKMEPGGKDKVARLEMHEAAFERGEVHFHQTMTDFADRLTAFPNLEHDDDIDALIYALDYSYKSGKFTKRKKDDTNRKRKSIATMGNIENQSF